MVFLDAGWSAPRWFGIAWEDDAFVATAVGRSRAEALRGAASCLPAGTAYEFAVGPSPFLRDAVRMLGQLERGDETHKRFALSARRLSAALRPIFAAAALVPIGYVTTYGAVARAAGSQARAVGRAMATNPLYPIVPCHRVVGADMSLVGYGGKRDERALAAKLDRLRAEARGMADAREIEIPGVPGHALPVIPVERVLEAAARSAGQRDRTRRRRAVREASRGLQLELL